MQGEEFMKKHAILYLAAAAILVATSGGASAQKTYKIDVSLETGPNHLRNMSMERWAEAINEKSAGRLKVTIFHGAKKFKGTNVPTALGRGLIDMGAPGPWHLSKFVPDFGVFNLPLAYGATRRQMHALMDGEIGKELNAKIEKKLGVKVIGRWLGHGSNASFFLHKKVTTYADIVGLKMRFSGSEATAERLKVFGARPTKIAWPDLPRALRRGLVDGFVTNHEAMRSAKLWEVGVKYAYDDRQSFAQYVPMISGKTWNRLPQALQDFILDSWESFIPGQREFAKQRHAGAREAEKKHGITIIKARPEDLKSMRKKLLAAQPAMVERLKMDKDFVARAQSLIEKAGTK